MKKRTFLFILIGAILLSSVVAFVIMANADSTVASHPAKKVMYAPNGKSFFVPASEVENYKSRGYGERLSDVQCTLYSKDGSKVVVLLSEVGSYKANGYRENIADVQTVLYSRAGEKVAVFNDFVGNYKNSGYRETIEEVQTIMYSPSGEQKTVFLAETDAYYRDGWRMSEEEVKTLVFSPSGEAISVFVGEVPNYRGMGYTVKQADRIDPKKPMVALTFDDGPRPGPTSRILNKLEQYNGRATFFVVGEFAVGQTNLLRRMRELNCQIGNHTYSHANLTTLSADGVSGEITRTSNIVYNATGAYTTIVRPPYGARNSTVGAAAKAPLILWSIDTLDWKTRNTQSIINEVLSKVHDGDIILMHDLYDTTAAAAEYLIPELIARGYQLVTVSELAAYRNITLVNGQTYYSFRR